MEYSTDNLVWKRLRYDSDSYTAIQARRSGNRGHIPEEYLYIDNKCFMGNGKVHEVILPPKCMIIGKQAFESCQFQKEVEFPVGLQLIGERAFAGNHRLRKVRFPKSLLRIGKECYKDCNSLTMAEFHSHSQLRVIPEGLFECCTSLTSVLLPEQTEVIGRKAFYCCKELKGLTFPETLKEIGQECFYFCSLEELQLPKRLERIGDSAFFRCKLLREIKVPKSVMYIGRWAFHGCNRLIRIEILHDPEYIGESIVNKNCMIRCYKGGKVDLYCKEHGLKQEYVSEE